MASRVDLIYCGGGNRRFYEIAKSHGFLYGAQLPNTVYGGELHFADQDWKNPQLDQYVTAVARHRPEMASVLDWERREQLSEVLMWAESIAPYVNTILIIPKVIGGVADIPRVIGGRPVRLAYSVPTRYGGTAVPYSEFQNRPVHLLGGSPLRQYRLTVFLNVVSADGNYHQKMATRWNQFFVYDGSARYAKNRFWPTLRESNGGQNWGDGSKVAGAPYEAFRRSCAAIAALWGRPDNNKNVGELLPLFACEGDLLSIKMRLRRRLTVSQSPNF